MRSRPGVVTAMGVMSIIVAILTLMGSFFIGVWATAMYAGLRLGELMALDWKHVDLDRDLIRVR